MTTVDVRDVTVTREGRAIVDGVSARVGAGRWLGLIGPNGAGKTTLLRAIAGVIAYRGGVTFDGTPAARLKRRERARLVALVPQRPSLPPAMSVVDYVVLGRTPHLSYFDTGSQRDRVIVERTLDRLDVRALAARALGSLSGGEQQRVVLARALAQGAPLLLLDEGTSALDIGAQQHVLELVDSLRRSEGLTVISAMHDLTLAGQFADSLALLSRGKVVASGSADDVLCEEIVAAHYGARVRITPTADGPAVTPRRAHDVEEILR